MPIAHSFPLADSSWWTLSNDPIPTLFEMSDFLDYHIYASTTPAQAAQAFTNSWGVGKHMVIGEFGVNETLSSDARTARYQQIRDIVASRTDIDGALAWSCWDLGSDPGFPVGALRRQPAAPHRHLDTVRHHPGDPSYFHRSFLKERGRSRPTAAVFWFFPARFLVLAGRVE